MRFLRAVGYGVVLWGWLAVFYAMAGGHIHVIFQPFEMLMIVAVYVVGFSTTGIPNDRYDLLKKLNSTCLFPAFLIPLFLGLIHTAGYADQDWPILWEHIGATATSVPLALMAFLAVEFTLLSEEAGNTGRFQPIFKKVLAGLGAFASIAFAGVFAFAKVDDTFFAKTTPPKENQRELQEYVNKAESEYYREHCEEMPSKEKQKLFCKFEQGKRQPASK
jgi:hypothetical protein